MDFLARFNLAVKRIDDGRLLIKPDTIKPKVRLDPVAHVSRVRLVTVYNDKTKVVAFGLTRYEAALLIPHIEKKLRRIMEPDGTGKSLFEVTQIKIEEET
jgi:hypothetical protein